MLSHATRPLHRVLSGVAATAAALLVLPATSADAATRGLPTEVCSADPPAAEYDDRDDIADVHVDAVDCLTEAGITSGYGYDEGVRYLPDADVFRGQMAAFVARSLEEAGVALPEATDQGFDDVRDDDVHAEPIRKLAAAGIVEGVGDDRYAGHQPVTRAQMATFLVNATAYAASAQYRADVPDADGVEASDLRGGDLPFDDVDPGDVHGPSIAGAHELGITDGVSATSYAPARVVQRDAMASFIARMLHAVTERTTVADRDTGALSHTVFTEGTEGGRIFEVKAGDAWARSAADPAGEETLELYPVTVSDDFTVVAGTATTNATRVEVEYEGDQAMELALVPTDDPDVNAWASPILRADVDAIVAYDDGEEVARRQP